MSLWIFTIHCLLVAELSGSRQWYSCQIPYLIRICNQEPCSASNCVLSEKDGRRVNMIDFTPVTLLDSLWTVWKQMIKTDREDPEMSPFLFHAVFFLFNTWCLHYPQCNLPAENTATKYFVLLFYICSRTPQDLLTDFNVSNWWDYSLSHNRSKQGIF